MNYQQTLTYLFEQLPMYQRVGKAAYKVNLDNTIHLCAILENPEQKFKSVHVAGTNGKGSTSHMMASILQEAGYNVGLYTSPHLKDFRERIKINGEMISESEVISFVANYKEAFEAIHLSFFEWTVGLAFSYFALKNVDIAIIETGLGGRLDSTNVILPELSVITNIGKDHTQFLGDTMEQIATEKAGIIKQNIPVVVGQEQSEVRGVFLKKSEILNCKIRFSDSSLYHNYDSDLKGSYQKNNINTAVTAIEELQEQGWSISNDNVKEGLKKVVANTGLLGRWQKLAENPRIICDTGHNEAGIKEIVHQLQKMDYNRLHVVFGVVNDKSIDEVLELLPKDAVYYFCRAQIPRSLDADELYEKGKNKGLKGKSFKNVKEALSEAKNQAKVDDLIFVGGSTFVVSEVL